MVKLLSDEYCESWLRFPESIYDIELFYELCANHLEKVNTNFKEPNKFIEDYSM